MLRLVTIPISHYCEKARWALERAGLDYREERHVQGIHRLAARRAGGGSTVPVLVTPDIVLADSAEILAWVDERCEPGLRLFPHERDERDEVEAICARLDDALGPAARRLIYIHMFTQHELMLGFNNRGVPVWEDRALRWGWPLAQRFVTRALGIEPGIEVHDEEVVWREFDFVAGLLADGRAHLCGERFGAADLTFASLAAAAVVPPNYGVELPQPEALSGPTAELVRRARAHPAGEFAMRMFSEQRHPPIPAAARV